MAAPPPMQQQGPISSMPQALVPMANGPGSSIGGQSMPPTLLQGSAAALKPPGAPAVQSGMPAMNGGLHLPKPSAQSPAAGVTTELRGAGQGAGAAAGFGMPSRPPAPPADSCARCRLWEGPGHGKVRPQRLDCAAYGGPVIANGDGTVANWLGLHGWQVVRAGGRQQGRRQGQRGSRSRQSRGSRKRNWDDSDVSYSGSDSEESDISSVPSELGGRGDKQNEADAPPPDPERPELHDSDEDSEYEAMRRAKERRTTARGRRVFVRARGSPPPVESQAPKRKRPRPAAKQAAGPAAAVPAANQSANVAGNSGGGGGSGDGTTAIPAGSAPSPAAAAEQRQARQPPGIAPAEVTPQQAAAVASASEAANASDAAPEGLSDVQPQQGVELQEEETSEEEEEEPEPEPVVLVRGLSEEEKAADRLAVRSSPNFATVLDFLEVFRPLLKLSRSFGAAELESVLVASPGDEGLLPDIHMDMLRGINPRILVGNSNWARHVASKLFNHWRQNAIWKFSDPPFLVAKDEDAAVIYSQLPSLARVAALKALCEMRLDKDDLRAAVDAAGGPRRRTKKGEVDESRTLDDFRRAPLGEDARDRSYWYHDFHDTTGLRLYRESCSGAAAQQSADVAAAAPQASDSAATAAPEAHPGDAAAPGSPGATNGTEASAELAAGHEDGVDDGEAGGAAAGSPSKADVGGETDSAAAAAAAAADEAPSAAAAAKQRSAAAAAAAAARAAADEAAAAEAAASAAKLARARGRSGGSRGRGGRSAAFNPPGSQVDEASAGAWECIATSVEELEAVGNALLQSGKAADMEMASLILEDLVPEAVDAAAEAQRREARRDRLQRDLASAIIPGGGVGRSRRQRKEVDYTYGDYNSQILSAVRGPKNPDEPIPKWALEADERPTPAEEVALGLRRGRSYRDANLAAGLPDERLNGRSGSRTPAVSGATSGDPGGDSDADAPAADGPARRQQQQQQHTSRLQHVAGPEQPEVLLPPGVGAPPPAPPSQVQFPTAAAPLPTGVAPPGDSTQQPPVPAAQPMDVDATQPQPPSQY